MTMVKDPSWRGLLHYTLLSPRQGQRYPLHHYPKTERAKPEKDYSILSHYTVADINHLYRLSRNPARRKKEIIPYGEIVGPLNSVADYLRYIRATPSRIETIHDFYLFEMGRESDKKRLGRRHNQDAADAAKKRKQERFDELRRVQRAQRQSTAIHKSQSAVV